MVPEFNIEDVMSASVSAHRLIEVLLERPND